MSPETTGETEKRQVDEGDQDALAREVELGDGPGGRHPEREVQRHGDGGGQEREPDGRPGIRLPERGEVGGQPLLERMGEHGRQRQDEEEAEKDQRRGNGQAADGGRLAEGSGPAGRARKRAPDHGATPPGPAGSTTEAR
jgi:hypothetical protein